MSVEVKNTERSRAAAEWSNIGKLYRVQLRQQKGIFIFMLFTSLMLVASLAKIILVNASDDWVYIQGGSSGITFVISVYVLIMYGIASNVLTNPSISMYPGTVKTRFLSRVFFDGSVILTGVVFSMLMHLVNIGILKLLSNTGRYVYGEILFDGTAFLMRSALWLGYLLLGYFLFLLFHVIGTKIGDKALLITCAVVMAAMAIGAKFGLPNIFLKIYNYYAGANLGLGAAMCRILVTIVVLFLLAYMIVSTVHSWHENSKIQIGVAIGLCYIAMMVGSLSIFSEVEQSSAREYVVNTLEEDITTGQVVVNDRIIRPGKVDAIKLNDSYENVWPESDWMDAGFSVGWCEYDQAKEVGLIDESRALASGEMLVRVVAPNDTYKDVSIFDGFITDLGVDIVDSSYVLTMPKRMLVYDDFLASMNHILGAQIEVVSGEAAEEMLSTLSCCQVYIIYHEEDVENAEELHSYDACYVSHTWYLPDEAETMFEDEDME